MTNYQEDKKSLISNFFSLAVLQGANMLLPLITLPYLVRVLGAEKFGLISFSLSIIMYFNILVSFGFELSATREISVNRHDGQKVSEIFSSVMIIKISLATLSLIILSVSIVLINTLYEYSLLYYMTFGIVIGNVIFPSWFFQGMERMQYITYINVISRIIFTIFIFILVQDEPDYIYVPILNSLGAIIGGFYSLWLIFNVFEVNLCWPSKKIIYLRFVNSYHFFLSRVANNGSRYYAITIIGLYFGNTVVGYYSMVEKLFYAFQGVGGVISQTIYPYMSRTKNIIFFKKVFLSITGISIILLVPILYFHEYLLQLIFNIHDQVLSNIFIIVFSGSVVGVISTLVGYPLLAAFGHIKYANNSLIYASIIYVTYISIAVLFYQNIYLVTFSIVVYSVFGLMFRFYYIQKTGILKRLDSE